MKKQLKNIIAKLSKPTKLVGLNPTTFDEKWSLITKPYQLISVLLILLILNFYLSYLLLSYTGLNYLLPKSATIESQSEILKTVEEVDRLAEKINFQERYIRNLQNVILGKSKIDSIFEITDDDMHSFSIFEIDTTLREEENVLSQEIEARQKVIQSQNNYDSQYMVDPVKGKISQNFNKIDHPAVDIVTKKDAPILSIYDGFVINSSYSDLDGWVVILKHINGFTSVYKHCKEVFIEVGDKVKGGDVIAVVGDSGRRSSGPHLHFELWGSSGALNPKEYFSFD